MLTTLEIDQYLAAFDRDPAAMMTRIPDKRTIAGAEERAPDTAFSLADIVSGAFVREREMIRARLRGEDPAGGVLSWWDLAPGKALIAENDRPADLVDALRYERLTDIEDAHLLAAQLAESPWSGYYWPLYLGGLGNRYAEPSFPASTIWKTNHDYILQNPAGSVVAMGRRDAIDHLSPAEKYDLLVGDAAGTLTQASWQEGESHQDDSGKVETWMGICHGWAPASYMFPRPRRTVVVVSPEGLPIRFFPADIKALASLLWANASPSMRFIGGRCEDKVPKSDAHGRLLASECFDTNPGTWHIAVVNQIGAVGRSFIMDATYDYEVWNQPIFGYEYHYFNPRTRRNAASLREATVPRGDLDADVFAAYRSPSATALVGIVMRVHYGAETLPDAYTTDDPGRDVQRTVDYHYDLELDASGRIIGGEWYETPHPDFLWSPPPGARALSPADALLTDTWLAGQPVPISYQAVAPRASVSATPLAKIVEQLIRLSTSGG